MTYVPAFHDPIAEVVRRLWLAGRGVLFRAGELTAVVAGRRSDG